MADENATIKARLIATVTGWVGPLKKADDALRKIDKSAASLASNASKRLNSAANSMRATAMELTATGAVLLSPLIAVTKVSKDFESAFAGVRKTVDASEQEFSQLRQGLRDMALEIPVSREELAGIMEIAGQLGVRGVDNLLAFTKTTAMLATSTNLTSEAAASMIAQYMNVMNMPLDRIGEVGAVLVRLGNDFATTESSIMEMTQRLSGAGRVSNMTSAQVMALATAMSSVGIQAEMGGSAMSRLILELTSASTKEGGPQAFAELLGITADEAKRLIQDNPSQALLQMFDALNKIQSEKGAAGVIPLLEELGVEGVRMKDMVLRASGAVDLFRKAMRISNDETAKQTALTTEAEQRYRTFDSQLQIFKSTVTDMAITIGDVVMPRLNGFLNETLKPIVVNMGAWVEKNGQAAASTVILSAEIGALAIGLGSLLIGLSVLTKGLSIIMSIIAGIGVIVGALATATSGWILGITAIVVALGAALWATFTDPISAVKAFFMTIWDLVKWTFDRTIGNVYRLGKLTWDILSGDLRGIQEDIFGIIHSLYAPFDEFFAWIGGKLDWVWDKASKAFAWFMDDSGNAEFGSRMPGSTMTSRDESKIPAFAVGGVVTAPMRALVGEAGPEAIIPLDRLERMMSSGNVGGATTIHVYQRPGEDGEMLAKRIAGQLFFRRGGGV